jgi:hypothetical protein
MLTRRSLVDCRLGARAEARPASWDGCHGEKAQEVLGAELGRGTDTDTDEDDEETLTDREPDGWGSWKK